MHLNLSKIVLPQVQPRNNREAGPEDPIESVIMGISAQTSGED